jgi:hypothetical protein
MNPETGKTPKRPPSKGSDVLKLHQIVELDESDHPKLMVTFEVPPGSNLFERGSGPGPEAPIPNLGRSLPIGERVVRDRPPRLVPGESAAVNMARLQAHARFLDGLGTWFLTVECDSQREAEFTGAQLAALQRLPPLGFKGACAIAELNWLPSVHIIEGAPDRLLTKNVFLPPPAPGTYLEDDELDSEDIETNHALDRLGEQSCRLILASLAADPTQTNPMIALQVILPRQPDTRLTLPEWVAKAGFPNGFGLHLGTYSYWGVRIAFVNGAFVPTLVEGAGTHPFPEALVQRHLAWAATKPSPDPEDRLLWALFIQDLGDGPEDREDTTQAGAAPALPLPETR